MFKKIRRGILKILSFVDYMSNEYDDVDVLEMVKYKEMKGTFNHKPMFLDRSEVFVFEDLEELKEFQNDCANPRPLLQDSSKYIIISVTPYEAKNGVVYFIVTTIQCSCNFCLAKTPLKYFGNTLESFDRTRGLGILISNRENVEFLKDKSDKDLERERTEYTF